MTSCVNCGSPLPSPSAECPNCATQVLPNTPTVADVPQINGYDVTRRIGEGGMGAVYLAQELALNRRVAIKLISGKMATDAESRARFLREARSMATIEHANVIRVYAFGEVASMPYLAMEFVDGETLADRIRRAGRLSVEDSVRLMRQVLLALEAAWEKGIVHRDIKPSNILLDRRDQVHVADFGLAKPAAVGDDPVLTHSGHILGTPYYLSPEQAQGFPTDFRSDIYSCGILFYEMLTGERPFEGTTPFAIVAKQIHEPLPPIRKVRSDVPSRVAKIIDVMTEKRPERRPSSYAELIGMFDALLGITPSQPIITTQTMAASGPIRVDSKKLRWIAIGAAGLFTALLAVWMIVTTGRRNTAREARINTDQRLAVAVAPFYGPDEDSAKEGRVMAALIERSIAEKVGAANVRIAGVDQTKEPVRSHEAARALGEKVGASVVVWGEAYALRNETEIQPYFTFTARKQEAPKAAEANSAVPSTGEGPRQDVGDLAALMNLSEQRSAAVKVQAEAPNQIEMRKTSAEGIGEMISFLAAVDAFYSRNDATLAMKFLEQAPRTADTLRLRGRVMASVGHASDRNFKGKIPEKAVAAWNDAASAFEGAIALDPNDVQTHADLADVYLLLGRFKDAVGEYTKAAAAGKPFLTHYAMPYRGELFVRDTYRAEWNGSGQLDDTGYLLAVNPSTEIVSRRYRMPGVIRAFRAKENGFEIDYADRTDSPGIRTLAFSDGRFDRPLNIGGNLLLRMKGMKSGLYLAENFEKEFSGMIDAQPAHPQFRPRSDVSQGVPKTLPDLEVVLREAMRRDPTQPGHAFYLGQTLWAEGRKAEAEELWRQMLSKDYGVMWSDWNWMAKAAQRLDQRSLSDRLFARALAERRKLQQPIRTTTLIERLINAPLARMHKEQKKDLELAYSWFRRVREVTGVSEADNYYAAAWAAHFRRIGDKARAASETAYWKESSGDPFNFTARQTVLDYAGEFFFVTWVTFVAGLLLVLRRAQNRTSLQTAQAEISRARKVALGAILIVACGVGGVIVGFGVAAMKRQTIIAAIVVSLLAVVIAFVVPRIFTSTSVIAAVRSVERRALLVSFLAMLAASSIFVHVANLNVAFMALPIGISDSLGHPAIVEQLEKGVAKSSAHDVLYTTAVANQLGGNTQRAVQLYGMLPGDSRAKRASEALAKGESYLAFPTQRELANAFSEPAGSWIALHNSTMDALQGGGPLPVMIYGGAALGLLFFGLCLLVKPAITEEAPPPRTGIFATIVFSVFPGVFDVARRSVVRGMIEVALSVAALTGIATFFWAQKLFKPPAGVGVATFLTEGMNIASATAIPPDTTLLDILLAPPYALQFWIVATGSLVAVTILHAMQLRRILSERRPSSPAAAPSSAQQFA